MNRAVIGVLAAIFILNGCATAANFRISDDSQIKIEEAQCLTHRLKDSEIDDPDIVGVITTNQAYEDCLDRIAALKASRVNGCIALMVISVLGIPLSPLCWLAASRLDR